MKISSGRPVDLSDINISEIIDYTRNSKEFKNCIKCHAIISLHNGNAMQDVCKVLGITRETIRKWKGLLRKGGLNEMLGEKKVGKRAKIDKAKLFELKQLIKQKPTKFGYHEKKWTGKVLVDYAHKKWNIAIGIRTAQLWIKQVR